MKKIPLIRPLIPAQHEVKPYLRNSQRANQWANFGPNYHSAVESLYKRTGRYMLPVSNGTTAIQLAILSTMQKGSRVAIPDYTHAGTYCAVRDAGMIPVIIKSERNNWLISLDDLYIHRHEYDSFIVVSPFGYYVDVEPYERFALNNGKYIVYDFAGAWGQFPKTDFPICYSLHATKSFSIGEGGLISFSDEGKFNLCRMMSNFDISPDGEMIGDYGSNYKMDEIRLAYVRAHLFSYWRIEKRIEKRLKTLKRYCGLLGKGFSSGQHTPSLCVISNMEHINPAEQKTFTCKFYYPLLSRIPALSHVKVLSKCDDYFTTCLALPTDVSEREQDMIVRRLNEDIYNHAGICASLDAGCEPKSI